MRDTVCSKLGRRQGDSLALVLGMIVAMEPRLLNAGELDTLVPTGDVVNILGSDEKTIFRYGLVAESWMEPLRFEDRPTAMTADGSHLFVAFDRRVARVDPSSGTETHLRNSTATIRGLFVLEGTMFLFVGGSIMSIEKETGEFIETKDSFYYLSGLSFSPEQGRIFGVSQGISPADIHYISVSPDGRIGSMGESPYHGDYPIVAPTKILPGGSRVATGAGIVYSSLDLSFNSSLAGRFTDMAFYGENPVLIREGNIVGLTASFGPAGTFRPTIQPIFLHVRGEKVYAFGEPAASGVPTQVMSIADIFKDTSPGEPIDPSNLPYVPDAFEMGADGILYLLSNANLSIFRWNVRERSYGKSIALEQPARFMSYSSAQDCLYLAYATGQITRLSLADDSEAHFTNLPQPPTGLAVADGNLFATDPSGAWHTHYVYGPDAKLLSSKDWNYYSRSFTWSSPVKKMFHFRDDTSPNDLIWEKIVDGVITEQRDSPYHGAVGGQHPIRVSADGKLVLLGSGVIFNSETLSQEDALSHSFIDGVFSGSHIYTIRDGMPGTQVTHWGDRYGIEGRRTIAGEPLRIFLLEEALLVATKGAGNRTTFHYLSPADLEDIPLPVAPYRRGDADQDGRLTVLDAIGVIAHLFGGEDQEDLKLLVASCANAANANGDAQVDLSDAIYVLNFLFRRGDAIPAPNACADPPGAAEALGCMEYDACPTA